MPRTRILLSVMMFLQYAIWGAWAPVLYPYLANTLHLSGAQAGAIFGALWLACIIVPFIGGQLSDRWVPTQKLLAVLQLLGAVVLGVASSTTEYGPLFWLMFLYSLLYAPTLALTNSLAFHHLKDAEQEFGRVRVFGTLGWIAAGWILTATRLAIPSVGAGRSDALALAAVASGVMGVFCFFLPHTPPNKNSAHPLAFLQALRMLRDRNFLVFIIISFLVTTELQFYYMPTAAFLQDLGFAAEHVPALMTVGQGAEILAMAFLLPSALQRLGIRKTLALGVVAWPLRYVIFAMGQPAWLVIVSLALHGVGYTFFFVASQIYVDKVAPPDIRGSAQSLLTFVTLGLGNWLGTAFTGFILDTLKTSDGAQQWSYVFLVPCALTVACAVAFLLLFHPAESDATSEQPAT